MTDTLDDTSTEALTATIDTYIASLNETDTAARLALIQQAWATDGAYSDPLQAVTGHEAISTMVGGIHEVYPGHAFRRLTGIDVHHGTFRFGWELAAADGTVTVAGIDVGGVGADGRIGRIVGFFGDLPDA